jgi:hypothetical protein
MSLPSDLDLLRRAEACCAHQAARFAVYGQKPEPARPQPGGHIRTGPAQLADTCRRLGVAWDLYRTSEFLAEGVIALRNGADSD